MKPKRLKIERGNLEVYMSTSTSVLNSLVVEVSESRLFSSNFVQLHVALVVVCPAAAGG